MDAFHENLFAAAALERGFLSAGQLDDCRHLQAQVHALGLRVSLTYICLDRGLLTPDQVAALERSVTSVSAGVTTPDLGRDLVPRRAHGPGEEAAAPAEASSGTAVLPPTRDRPPVEAGAALAPPGDASAPMTLGVGPVPTPAPGRDATLLEASGDHLPPTSGGARAAMPLGHIGEYALVRELGRGGMGVVYEAIQSSLGRRVALKVLHPAAVNEEKIQRFRREAAAVAKLNHKNIVRVYGAGEENGVYYYAMEFLEGKTTDEVVRAEQAAPERIARWMAQAADALDYAHANGIIHRDIKPVNLMVTRDDHLAITDFGLARDEAADNLTASGQVLGTPRYMSPEQAEGDRYAIDGRTDVYSLGVAMHELLTRKPLFEGETVAAILQKIIFEEPPSVCALNPAVPRDLETIALKALSKERERRYVTAGHMRDDLDRFLRGDPISARPTSLITKGMRKVRRNRLLVVTLAVSVLVVGGITIAWLLHRRANEAREREVARADGLLRTGDVKEAIQVYTRILGETPGFVPARLHRAGALAGQGKRAEARADLDEVLRLDPRNASALLERGRLRRRDGDATGAIADLSATLALMPTNDVALSERGWARIDAGEPAAADPDFTQALACARTSPTRAMTHCGAALVRVAAGDADAAARLLDQAIEEDIECARAYLERGRLQFRARRYAAAITDFTQAVKRDADGIEALLERAAACHAALEDGNARSDCREAAARAPADPRAAWCEARFEPDARKAIEAATRAVTLSPDLAAAWLLRGWLRVGLGETAAAGPDFERARDLARNPAAALAGLSGLALRRGELDAALDLAARAIAADATCSEGHGARAEALERKGDAAAARAEYERCESLARAESVDGMDLARMAEEWGRFHKGVDRDSSVSGMDAAATRIVQIGRWLLRERPHFGQVAFVQARGLWMAADFERALEATSDALRRDPYLACAWLFRARLRTDQSRTRDPAKARADAEVAARLAPDDPRPLERIGLARLYADDFAGALDAFDRARQKAPDLAVLQQRRALALRKLGRDPEAEEAFAQWKKAKPDAQMAQEYLNVGHFCFDKKKQDVAIFLLTRAVEEFPRSPDTLTARGNALGDAGKVEQSLLDQAHAMELDARESVKVFAKAERYVTKTRVSVQLFTNVINGIVQANPEDAGAYGLRAFLNYLVRNADAGIKDADRALELDPDFAVIYSVRGILRARKGEREQAARDLEDGMKRAPRGGVPQYLMAQYAALAGDKGRALEYLRRSLELGFEEFKDVIRRETDFASLQGDAEFERLVQER